MSRNNQIYVRADCVSFAVRVFCRQIMICRWQIMICRQIMLWICCGANKHCYFLGDTICFEDQRIGEGMALSVERGGAVLWLCDCVTVGLCGCMTTCQCVNV